MTDNVIKPTHFSNGASLESLYRDFIAEIHDNLIDQRGTSEDQVMVIIGSLAAMRIAFVAKRNQDTANFLSGVMHNLQVNWRCIQSELVRTHTYLDEQC